MSLAFAALRVAERVAHGGHDIPLADIERRFSRSLAHLLHDFSHAVDACRCFMNSGPVPEPVFEQQGSSRNILSPALYAHLQQEARP